MKCRQCKGELSRNGKWFSIRVYELESMIALPFCTGLCLAKRPHDTEAAGKDDVRQSIHARAVPT